MNTTNKGIIIIADDDRFCREALGRVLRGAGYAVTEVASTRELFILVEREPVALCVIDFHLDGGECGDIVERLRRCYDIPTIIITGDIDPAAEHRARGCSPAFLFFKPVNMDDFLTVVDRILTHSKHAPRYRGFVS